MTEIQSEARETIPFSPHKVEVYGWDIVVTVISDGEAHVIRYIDRKESGNDAMPDFVYSISKKAEELFPGCVVLSWDVQWHCYEADLSEAEAIE